MFPGYKIVLRENGELKTLFHGVNGTRTLEFDKWIRAKRRIVSDGKGGRRYISGFHFFFERKDAEKYLQNFRTEKDRIIVRCYVRGYRPKASNPKVMLADDIMFPKQSI